VKAIAAAGVVLVLSVGCSTVPRGAYFPRTPAPTTIALAHSLYRAAQAAGDDPGRYSFALVRTDEALAWCDANATVYFSDGLARLPLHVVEPMVAREVAHEVLGHYGVRRNLSLSISAGFTVLGVIFPGAGPMDFIVNPIVVRAVTREQDYAADQRAVEILRAMGYAAPRRALSSALVAVDRLNGLRKRPPTATPEPGIEGRLAALGPLEEPAPEAPVPTPGAEPQSSSRTAWVPATQSWTPRRSGSTAAATQPRPSVATTRP
jgi:Zn-dependent protease with chaperone function